MVGILQRLLVATDGSANGDHAVSVAIAIARRHNSEVLLCYAVDNAAAIAERSRSNVGPDVPLAPAQVLDNTATSILTEATKRVRDAGLPVTPLVLSGRSAESLVACANERHVDAIVMGTHGKRSLERFFMGSTADGVLRRIEVPTFFVPPGEGNFDPKFDRILVAVDDSDPSDAATAFAIDLARVVAAKLVFCGVVESVELLEKAATYGYDSTAMLEELRATTATLLEVQADSARKGHVAFESVITEGDPADNILRTAEAQKADLIVVGTHGRRGLRRLFVGSVTESIVRRSPVPVVVIRTSHLRAAMDISRRLSPEITETADPRA